MIFSMLQEKYEAEGPERVGFILSSGEVVEVENVSDDPENAFKVSLEDIIAHEANATGTWHTHPGGTSNLSVSDYKSFQGWPNLTHHIIGSDGVAVYRVVDGDLIRD